MITSTSGEPVYQFGGSEFAFGCGKVFDDGQVRWGRLFVGVGDQCYALTEYEDLLEGTVPDFESMSGDGPYNPPLWPDDDETFVRLARFAFESEYSRDFLEAHRAIVCELLPRSTKRERVRISSLGIVSFNEVTGSRTDPYVTLFLGGPTAVLVAAREDRSTVHVHRVPRAAVSRAAEEYVTFVRSLATQDLNTVPGGFRCFPPGSVSPPLGPPTLVGPPPALLVGVEPDLVLAQHGIDWARGEPDVPPAGWRRLVPGPVQIEVMRLPYLAERLFNGLEGTIDAQRLRSGMLFLAEVGPDPMQAAVVTLRHLLAPSGLTVGVREPFGAWFGPRNLDVCRALLFAAWNPAWNVWPGGLFFDDEGLFLAVNWDGNLTSWIRADGNTEGLLARALIEWIEFAVSDWRLPYRPV